MLLLPNEQAVETYALELVVVAFALLSGHALMFPLREALGWQLAFMPPERTSHGSGVRWSLLQLVGWTSFLALAFAFARLVMEIDVQGSGRALPLLIRVLSEGLVRLVMLIAVINYGCIAAAWRPGWWVIAGAFLFDAGSQLLWSWLNGYGPAWAESLITSLGTLAAALVIIRSLHWAGLRLYRPGNSPIPAVESATDGAENSETILTPVSH